MPRRLIRILLVIMIIPIIWFLRGPHRVIICGSPDNDLIRSLKHSGLAFSRADNPVEAVKKARRGSGFLILANGYPANTTAIPDEVYRVAKKRKLKLYVEYAGSVPGLTLNAQPLLMNLERGIILSDKISEKLTPMSLVGLNHCYIQPVAVDSSLMVMAKVAGFDKAEYGTSGVPVYPLLFEHQGILVATSRLSSFATGRFGPVEDWKEIWKYILQKVSGNNHIQFTHWASDLAPAYPSDASLPADARRNSIIRGTDWFFNGRFFIDPSWKEMWLKYQGDGTNPFGPPVPQAYPNGDGSLGILEGHASRVAWDGAEEYRYWIRNDVQGEVSMALAAVGQYLDKEDYKKISANLIDFIFGSIIRNGPRNDPNDPNYGLMGWSLTHPWVYYQDDNARSLLGIIGASANIGTGKWDRQIAEGIIANFRTTGVNGFRGERILEQDLTRLGLAYFQKLELINPHPHFESWIWATYLWLYDKTKYQPLLVKTERAIRLTMEAYPDKWAWTNGIQQERARMILPLAWLVRVADTPEHRQWLDTVVNKLLENQVECGAIREELGKGSSPFDQTHSNAQYGLYEAPLIFRNGDPVADMLYTSNFAFFGLQEAWKATGNPKYQQATNRLSDFLTRIQVRSNRWKDLDGAWFRAFDYQRGDYWASNADAGWGAWGTLTGWIQSWIVYTQVLAEKNTSFWEQTSGSKIGPVAGSTISLMMK